MSTKGGPLNFAQWLIKQMFKFTVHLFVFSALVNTAAPQTISMVHSTEEPLNCIQHQWVSIGFEPMTFQTPGGRSIHWATRTYGEPVHLTVRTQLNDLALLLGLRFFLGPMLVLHYFTYIYRAAISPSFIYHYLSHIHCWILQEAGDACHVRTQLNDLALHEFL